MNAVLNNIDANTAAGSETLGVVGPGNSGGGGGGIGAASRGVNTYTAPITEGPAMSESAPGVPYGSPSVPNDPGNSGGDGDGPGGASGDASVASGGDGGSSSVSGDGGYSGEYSGDYSADDGFGIFASGGTVTKSKAKNKNSFMSMKGK
tara:strand:- start:1 stop:447 length:447 start_codon:yes stop_codon:yes gene_type:complete